jgi:hypothetical protein
LDLQSSALALQGLGFGLRGSSLQGLHGSGGAAHHYLLVLLFELYLLDAKAKLLCVIKRVN